MADEKALSMAIIGGGASAVLLLAHLAEYSVSGKIRRITVFDRSGRYGLGIAYGTDNKHHLLNVRASNMSALQDDPAHFFHYLEQEKLPYEPADFVPRVIYGQYLKKNLAKAQRHLARQGCEVFFSNKKIMSYEDAKANIVVLANGNAVAHRPKGEGFYENPWGVDYRHVKGDVIIIGTGLSMIDSVVALHGAGYKGKIMAISRRGLLPRVHVEPEAWPPFHLSGGVVDMLKKIRSEVKKAKAENIPWQAVIDSLRKGTNQIWLRLDDAEKKKTRRLMTFWNVHRHRMAPEIAGIVSKMNIEIVKDDVVSVGPGKVTGRKGSYKAEHIINCLGYGRDEGFEYSPDMERDGIFALGPALQGVYFETTAIPEIRAQASEIAKKILDR